MYKFVCFLDGNATEKVSRADYIWELKQGRRGRQGESHLRVSAIISACTSRLANKTHTNYPGTKLV